ncbi:TraR/DksA family transcriptional regulator [Micromonospora sp. NPDC047707]|uniref:TraR/DksA family transcriptional regulator n=1 Tax=unclassified Micromonospora TaxID=2617518 RepID=UPI0012B4F5FB|nr:TraR/DksA family transcriptional regulator [Micromonospora sp. WMMC415]QGN50083.1 TraR/DksA family transcriptional regulator [Micromonospora sp. WMMC415]
MTTQVQPDERNWLDELRTALTHDFEVQSARLTQLTADTGDPGEAHTQDALIAATRQSLNQISDALRRIAEGRYGTCERCAAPIPRERLEVLPHARFCVPCQQKHAG